jgi:hypothetical protein
VGTTHKAGTWTLACCSLVFARQSSGIGRCSIYVICIDGPEPQANGLPHTYLSSAYTPNSITKFSDSQEQRSLQKRPRRQAEPQVPAVGCNISRGDNGVCSVGFILPVVLPPSLFYWPAKNLAHAALLPDAILDPTLCWRHSTQAVACNLT